MRTIDKHFLCFCSALALCSATYGQEDVTSVYLTNPSFEADASSCTASSSSVVNNSSDGLRGWNISPTGWETTNPGVALLINKDCFTDNNFGKTEMADGTLAYYQRVGWSSATSELKQTTASALPPGEYALTFHTKAYCANNAATSAIVSVRDKDLNTLASTAVACAPGSNGIMASSPWNEHTLKFKIETETAITLSSQMTWASGGSCMAYDHFTLTLLPEGGGTPEGPEIVGGTEDQVSSPTEGIITHEFTDEATMQADLLQMLANSMRYAKNIWYDCAAPNSKNEACGYFKANSAGNSNEDGVRTNADFSMICAFLCRYGQGKVSLPEGVSWNDVKNMAMKSLIFGYSTHKANKFKITSNNAYWGSTGTNDYVWESSLWTMSLAYASHFLADDLSDAQKTYVYNMIKAECNYELNRNIPTGFKGDTKSEENGWETNVLACALGLYPDDPLAPRWFARLREFAINCYSHVKDADNSTVIDPDYDNKTVQDLYVGKNLYDDYTLQNHNYFHTSYQNVVMQELGESHLALHLFQGENPKWTTNALMHNNRQVMDEVLCRLALADGELAMPNGNDWSMFLYDQITSYTTAACFLRDPNALMLENLAYKNIKARQSTTTDGSWLLNSDIGPRRMGVEGHRVMMTYLMHELASTANLQPTEWTDFSKNHEEAYLFTSQNIVRANTPDRFSVFSWSAGLNSYTGYIASNKPDKNKIFVPYKANNTGNILGWYTVNGKGTNAAPALNGVYDLNGNSYTMNGRLTTNDNTLENNFTIYSTPGNAFIYMDYVTGKANGIIVGEQGGLMAVSTDPFTKEQRTLYHAGGRFQSNGSQLKTFAGNWVNIDNEIGIVNSDKNKGMAFGDRMLSSSIYLSKIYPSYSTEARSFANGSIVDRRHIIYYNNVDSAATSRLAAQVMPLSGLVAEGWNGVIVSDPDSARYLLLSNYAGETACILENIMTTDGASVFTEMTTVTENGSTATFRCDRDHSIANTLRIYVSAAQLSACQMENDSCGAYLYNRSGQTQHAAVTIWAGGSKLTTDVTIGHEECIAVKVVDGAIVTEKADIQEEKEAFTDVTAQFLVNPNFEEDETWSTTGSATLNGTTYNPCYLNNAQPADTKWAQIYPVKGWTNDNGLTGGSAFAVMYSMPYSNDMYCISPSNIGNSACIMAAPATEENAGTRCLRVLNSWDSGVNRITQTASLPKGEYKLSFLAKYVCNDENAHLSDDVITTTGNNINTSLCGLSYGNVQTYRYPRVANGWERIEIPFATETETAVTVSMGFKTTANVGAAGNTCLYLDDIRLYSKQDGGDCISSVGTENGTTPVDVYNLKGIKLRSRVNASKATQGLPEGIYIIGNKKIYHH